MKAITAAVICSIFTNGLAEMNALAQSSQLAQRLAEYSKTGQAFVHKEYREDKQTVTQKDGQFVVHTETVFGQQNDNEDPVITKSEDEFVIPIEESADEYNQDQLNKLWNALWDDELFLYDDTEADTIVDPLPAVEPLPQPIDSDTEVPEWELAPWKYTAEDRDALDRLLSDTDDVVIPDDSDNYAFSDNFFDFKEFYDVMDYDVNTGRWNINPVKFENKYGIKPFGPVDTRIDYVLDEEEDALDAEIDALDADIVDKEADIQFNQQVEDALIDEELAIEDVREEQEELNIDDIVSIDPITGKIAVDEEGYYKMFGVYPSFEYEAVQKEIAVPETPVLQKPVLDNMDDWFMNYGADKGGYGMDKDLDKWWNDYRGVYPSYDGVRKRYGYGNDPSFMLPPAAA